MDTVFIIIGIILVLLAVVFVSSYVKVRPDKAVIITGPKGSRIVTGKATLRIPFFQRIDMLPLDLIQVDIRTSSAVPTNEFINIFVDGVANIKIQSDEASIRLAGEIFLTRSLEDVKQIAKEVLEGNMREIIGQMKLRELVQNRDKFAEQVKLSALADMKKMGLDIVNITIQNFADKNGVIDDLGVDNIAQIRKDASIARANSEKEVEIATSKAKELANDARIKAELEIEQQNNLLALRQAELKQKADIAKATADASYEIQYANEAKTINISKQNAEIARRDKEIELRGKEVEVEEKTLEARIKKSAEAERYAQEQRADADLYVRTKEAEAKLAEEERRAQSIKLAAEADRFAQEQRAIGIQAVGIAEAEAIEKKALAMKKMESAAVLELVLNSNVLPNIVKAASEPLSKVDKITMYGEGNSTKLVGDIVNTSTKVIESIKESTGLDLASLLAGYAGGKLNKETNKE
ncbi:MAG: SPFH domain-containing protein [Acholeplasma sp.]|nr:SPFH domain-containing protein [Acholeplasma sp.]